MTHMILFTKQKQTYRYREQIFWLLAKGREVGEAWFVSLGLADASYCI